MTRGGPAGLALVAGVLGALPWLGGACSSPAALLGPGAQCLQTTDCREDLFCVPQKSGVKTCSADLASIVSTEEAGAVDAPVRDAWAEGGDAAGTREGGTSDAGGAPDGGQATDGTAPSEAQAPADDAGSMEAGD